MPFIAFPDFYVAGTSPKKEAMMPPMMPPIHPVPAATALCGAVKNTAGTINTTARITPILFEKSRPLMAFATRPAREQ